MKVRSLMPFSGGRSAAPRSDADPFTAFRREMDRLFDDFFTGFGAPLSVPASGERSDVVIAPRIDASETDEDIRICAELPGIEEEDIEVTLSGDMLTIRAEKDEEREEDERDYHLMERSMGTYARSLRLPFPVDPGEVDAVFRNGVLTITIPKPGEARQPTHRIAIKGGEAGTVAPDRAAAGDKPGSAGASE